MVIPTHHHATQIASQLKIRPQQVTATIDLLDSGNTIPFIARYRKEVTGSLNEEQLRDMAALLEKLRALDSRRETIVATIESQGKLTPALKQQLLAATTLTALEDLYQPYKPKRRTRAGMAREKGLEELAQLILSQKIIQQPLEQVAARFLSEQVATVEEAFAGARDIVAERISDHPEVRRVTREKALQWGVIETDKIATAEDSKGVYKDYYEFEFRVEKIRPYQVLAMNRGESEKILRVHSNVLEKDWRMAVEPLFPIRAGSSFAPHLQQAILDAASRLLLPAIERDVRRTLTEQAELHAIAVFATNLRHLLTQPPLTGQVVLGLDPGFRTGCKIAVIDPTGKILETATIYPHAPQHDKSGSLKKLTQLIEWYGITLIAIGNGTASRESEQLVAELTGEMRHCKYLIVNEAGASVYSASLLAKSEMPNLDVTLRGAVSIARRVQDPLAELVKIEPKAIGVGMYQHDVDQTALAKALDGVVESVVNLVGVEVNTASPALLTHVSGIGPKLAERVVTYREQNGPFKNRQELKKISGFGPKTFEQAAGFLRIRDGNHPLDGSAIHPESYHIAQSILKQAGITMQEPPKEREKALQKWQGKRSLAQVGAELGTGIPTLSDICKQLIRPGRDPRADMPTPLLRNDVLSLADLKIGMRVHGTVRNVVDFGAFIDIGVKQDGLLHRSHWRPGTKLSVGDVIEVEIAKIEPERGRIGLA